MFWLLIWEFGRLYYREMQNKVFVMCIIVEQGCFLTELRIAGKWRQQTNLFLQGNFMNLQH